MKRKTQGLAMTGAIITMIAGSAQAGEITRAKPGSDFKWTSTECRKPARPYILSSDPNRQTIMQAYALQVEIYIDCLKQEAQRDFDRAQVEMQEAVQGTLQAEVDALNEAVEAMVRNSR